MPRPLSTAVIDDLLPPGLHPIEHWESTYPRRDLPDGAKVTRFGPSPTGFIHIGGVYVATIAKSVAVSTGGVYFVRIEDTDQNRHLDHALDQFARAFAAFDIEPTEPPDAPWAPYEQSKRAQIYQSYVHELLARGSAYPCFCSAAELAEMTAQQQAAKQPTGYWGRWAKCRDLPEAEVVELLAQRPFTIRFRSPDGPAGRFSYVDGIRGRLEMADNRNDIVILKASDNEPRLPTYHLAHVVDDHLMRVNLVIRGDEWISSVPLHSQLFEALDLEPVTYAHIAPLMKLEGNSRRKLSKRKDPEASVDFYISHGYPQAAVLYYLRGLANGRLAELPTAVALVEPIRLDECKAAGPLVDLVKLGSISKDVIAEMPAGEVADHVRRWAAEYDADVFAMLQDEKRAIAALEVERVNTERVRKDLAAWSDFKASYSFFFPDYFDLITSPADGRFQGLAPEAVRSVAARFIDSYEPLDDPGEWLDQVRKVALALGFAPSVKELKKEPDRYIGSIREVANVLRVLITGASRSPDLFEVARVLGPEEVKRRVRAVL